MSENLPAEIQSVQDMLNQAADEEPETGLLAIKIKHQAAIFQSVGFGNGTEFNAIILGIEKFRALWPFGSNAQKEKAVKNYFDPLPICGSRGVEFREGIGELTKALKDDAAAAVKEIVGPIIQNGNICKQCPWGQWGSDIKGGRGQQCRLGQRFLLYSPETNSAAVMAITATSLKSWRNYRAGLVNGHYSMVVTNFSLIEQSGNFDYCICKFTAGDPVTSEMLAPLAKTVSYQGQDVMYAKALRAEFLNLSLEKEAEFDDKEAEEADNF